MKRMKSRRLNSALIAVTLAASIAAAGAGIASLNAGDGAILGNAYADGGIKYYAGGATYYVGLAEGADESQNIGDGTQANPYSLKKFTEEKLGALQPGDVVKFTPGEHIFPCTYSVDKIDGKDVYTGSGKMVVTANGTYDKYIIFEAADPTQNTCINFKQQSFSSLNRGVEVKASYIYWHDVNVCGAGDNGMYIGGSYNVVENCEFYNNRDTGLQLGRSEGTYANIADWPSYNLIKNCTSYNNYDNETYGENADGFAAKLTVGYGNMFDGCIAYRNSDDGWDLYAKSESGNIGAVIIYNCVAFENGFIQQSQAECNAWYTFTGSDGKTYHSYNSDFDETGNTHSYATRDGDGNGFKLGGGTMEGDVILVNCMAFNNRMHGVTDNSNPGVLSINKVTAYNNGAIAIDDVTSPNYGKITSTQALGEEESRHANIDIERTTLCYNNFTDILSINNGSVRMSSDAFRGSGEYSVLTTNNSGTASTKITANLDADSKAAVAGMPIDSPLASATFAALPSDDLGIHKDGGTFLHYIHKTFRNTDNSINMGDVLKIVAQPISGHDIGCDLTKTTFAAYPDHYVYHYMNDAASEMDARLQAVADMLYIPANQNAVYQDFKVVMGIKGVRVSWSSSDNNVLKIAGVVNSPSGSDFQVVEVWRQPTQTQVTLTATLVGYVGTEEHRLTRDFVINVMPFEGRIGEIHVAGLTDNKIIINQYSIFNLPAVTVSNATDNNGKLLDSSLYTVSTKVYYSVNKGDYQNAVYKFTPSKAGVYEIVHTVTYTSTGDHKDYSYNLFVVSATAKLDFVDKVDDDNTVVGKDYQVGVDYNGFYITGNLNNVSGRMYTMVADTAPSASELVAKGDKYVIDNDYIYVNYKQDNSKGAYTVYFVLCNTLGEPTSEVYSGTISTQDITNKEEFNALMESGGSTNVIYKLTCDLNYTGDTYRVPSKAFVGYLDGNNHTISGINIKSSGKYAGIFYQMNGGVLINVKFNDIKIEGTQYVGIVAHAYSGYFYNISMTNVSVKATEQRAGGLIGGCLEQVGAPLVVDRVSLINDEDHSIQTGTNRAAGILGFVQAKDSPRSDTVDIRISNCYVDSLIGANTSKEVGGIVGTFDSEYSVSLIKNWSLKISNCVFVGTGISNSRLGGILGYHKGLQSVEITNCVSMGHLYHAGANDEVLTAQKNCSGIVGGYPTGGRLTVVNCYARFIEHNSSADVNENTLEAMATERFWVNVNLDYVNVWEIVKQGDAIVAPYVRLR